MKISNITTVLLLAFSILPFRLEAREMNGDAKMLLAEARQLEAENKFSEAISTLKKLLALEEKDESENEKNIALVLEHLGSVHLKKNDFRSAELLFRRSLYFREKIKDTRDIDLSYSLSGLGAASSGLGKTDLAMQFYKRVLEIEEQAQIPDPKKIAIAVQNVGALLYKMQDLEKVESFLLRALRINESMSNPFPPDEILTNLGALHARMSNYSAAEQYLLRAKKVIYNEYGEQHANMVRVLGALGNIYLNQNRNQLAVSTLNQAMSISRKLPEKNLADFALILNDLGAVLAKLGDANDSIAHISEAVQIWTKIYGPEHAFVAAGYRNLTRIYLERKEYQKARELCLKGIAIQENLAHPDRKELASLYANLGAISNYESKRDEAEFNFQRAVELASESLGSDHPGLAKHLQNLGVAYLNSKKYDKAEFQLRRALAIRERALGPSHADVIETRRTLLLVLQATGQEKEKVEPALN